MANNISVTMGETEYKIPTAYVDAQREQGKEFSRIVNEYVASQNLENHLQQSSTPPSSAPSQSPPQVAEITLEGIRQDRQTGDWYVKAGGNNYRLPKAYVDQGVAQQKGNAQIALEGVQSFQPISSSPIPPPHQEVQEPVPQQVATASTKPNWINTANEWVGNNKVATGIGAAGTLGVLTLAGLAVQNAARQQQEQDEYERQLRYMTGWR